MREYARSERLSAAARFVRQGAVFADVGTDHAYLPLLLLSEGRISRAVCTDVREGPLQSAREHAAATPYFAKMTFLLADGAACLAREGVTDVAICGMGGELIADIIARAPFLRDPARRLILQPMTRHAALRRYLAREGFFVSEEAFPVEEGRRYAVLSAFYGGVPYTLTPLEEELGALSREKLSDPDFLFFARARCERLRRIAEGKRCGGEIAEETGLVKEIEEILRERGIEV